MRFKKTEVCQTCSKMKNTCQTCLLDLEYGLPVQTRDQALAIQDNIAKSDVNKEFFTQNMEREIANTDGTAAVGRVGKAQKSNDLLLRLARTQPYYKRNRPHICSFWVKGTCKRGEECPYRHEKPTDPDDPLSDQNIKDRYYGINDPVANKLMARLTDRTKQELPPADESITTLYVGGLGEAVGEKELKGHFYQFGEIHLVFMSQKHNCAFVQFVSRKDAEEACSKSAGRLVIKGRRLNVKWGRSQSSKSATQTKKAQEEKKLPQMRGVPGALPQPDQVWGNTGNMYYQPQAFNIAPPTGPPAPPGTFPNQHQIYYPSQDPNLNGAK